MARFLNGVDDGARTHDRWNHNPELYQLSYAHHCSARYSTTVFCCCTLWEAARRFFHAARENRTAPLRASTTPRRRPAGLESIVAARRFFHAARENRTAPRALMRSSRAFGTSRICFGSSPIEYQLRNDPCRHGSFLNWRARQDSNLQPPA
jgi:hypothetical protein